MCRTVDMEAMFWNLDNSDVRRRDGTEELESECGGGARGERDNEGMCIDCKFQGQTREQG
jgi:hypothetical protein